MKSIAIYILGITFLSLVLIGLTSGVKIPEGACEMQIYATTLPEVESLGYIDEMSNFNIYHYYDGVVGIKDKSLDNTLGVAYVYPKNNSNVEDIIDKLNAKICFEQQLEDGISYYGYVRGLDKSVDIQNKEINVQIVSNKDNIIVGFPLIMGSY